MFGIGILYLIKDLGERSLSDSEHSAGYTHNTYVYTLCPGTKKAPKRCAEKNSYIKPNAIK